MIEERKGYREEDAPDLGQAARVCFFCLNYTHGPEDSVPFRPWARVFPTYRRGVRAHRSCLRMLGIGTVPSWAPIREEGG